MARKYGKKSQKTVKSAMHKRITMGADRQQFMKMLFIGGQYQLEILTREGTVSIETLDRPP